MSKKNYNKLKSKIKKENLIYLSDEEFFFMLTLKKLIVWQEEYSNWVDWDDFRDGWSYCKNCKSYSEGQCICHTR